MKWFLIAWMLLCAALFAAAFYANTSARSADDRMSGAALTLAGIVSSGLWFCVLVVWLIVRA